MGSSARIGKDIALIKDEGFTELCRLAPETFIRRRKMPHDLLLESVVARKGRTLKIELRGFARECSMNEAISAPGYLKQREKLNPEALLYLVKHHAHNIYAEGDSTTHKDMLLIAIDGSTADLPTTPETIERYGNVSGHGKPQAMMGISAAFDVLNRQIVDMTINRGGFDERAQVEGHIGAIREVTDGAPFMLIMDRWYPSFALMAQLEDAGIPYVMRAQSNFMNAEFRRSSEAGGDSLELAEFTYTRLASIRSLNEKSYESLKDHASLPVRCVLVDVAGSMEKIVTNIGSDVLSAADLKDIYHLRWGIETCFQMLKDRLQMENFTGSKPILIEQDVYASAYLLNVAFDMANEADTQTCVDSAGKPYKHEMTVNRSLAIGILKDEFIRLVLSGESERSSIMDDIAEELRRNLAPARKNRSYSRKDLNANRANRYSNTHKRVF